MPVATALADAMSLALANIALREKLRTQALRDPLTGLYNRRYMEDVLDRYVSLAERSDSPLSIVMIDLDHFKRLNDDFGHAVGDAVLCEVAAAIIGTIRPGDVACRYGGEELVVLFPDCGMIEALAKAEMLRARIERLSENHGTADQRVVRRCDDSRHLVEGRGCSRRCRRGHVPRQGGRPQSRRRRRQARQRCQARRGPGG